MTKSQKVVWQDFPRFFVYRTYVLSTAAQPAGGFSLTMWYDIRGNKKAFQQFKIYFHESGRQ